MRCAALLCGAGPVSAVLVDIEALKAATDALQEELSGVSRVAEASAKRSRRLAARSQELQVRVGWHKLTTIIT